MDFDGLVAWIDAHLGEQVFAATQTLHEDAGNTRLSVHRHIDVTGNGYDSANQRNRQQALEASGRNWHDGHA